MTSVSSVRAGTSIRPWSGSQDDRGNVTQENVRFLNKNQFVISRKTSKRKEKKTTKTKQKNWPNLAWMWSVKNEIRALFCRKVY